MHDLVKVLMNVKNIPRHKFIVRPELIQGYTEAEIKEIEQRYNLSIHGQFKELLMTMGRCSGGLLLGKELFIYNGNYRPTIDDFGISDQKFWQYDEGAEEVRKQTNNIDFTERQLFLFANNDGEAHNKVYFLLTKNPDDIIYCWDFSGEEETVKPYGTLFDFLLDWRRYYVTHITGEDMRIFKNYTTGRLL